MSLRRVLFVAATVVALWVPVFAHADLARAVPAPGSTVGPELAEIRLTFTEALSSGSTVEVLGEGFQSVPGLTVKIVERELVAVLAGPLMPGAYTVHWAIVTADGHSQSGSYQFAIGAAASTSPVLSIVAVVVVSLGLIAYFARRLRSIR
jgi:hypothetical protein